MNPFPRPAMSRRRAERQSDQASPAPDLVRIVRAALLFLTALAAPAVAAPDEKNLQQVIDYFYLPAKPLPTAEQKYKFLSSETRRQIDRAQWKEMYSKQPRAIDSAAILGQVKVDALTYGVVAVTEKVQGRKTVSTATWVLEGNGWRRLMLPRHAAAIAGYLRKGDYEAVVNEAEAWRREDPFSVHAYSAVIVCKTRTGDKLLEAAVDDLVDDLLTINPEDTDSLLLAVSSTEDPVAAQAYLDKLKGTTAYEQAVDVYVAGARNRESAGIHLKEEELLIQQLVILAELDNMTEFHQLAAEDDLWQRLTAYFDGQDSDRAAGKAARLGLAFHKAGDRATSLKWLEYGKSRNPGNADVLQLAAMLGKDTHGIGR